MPVPRATDGWLSYYTAGFRPTMQERITAVVRAIAADIKQLQAITAPTTEAVTYFAGAPVTPNALTAGLNLFWLRNASATQKIKLPQVEVTVAFSGEAAAGTSLYSLSKFTDATSTTGAVTLTPVPAQTSNPASIADVKWSAGGGALTGATIGASVLALGHANQPTAGIPSSLNLAGAPLVLSAGEGLVLQTDSAIAAGSTVIISLHWTEDQTP